MENSPTIYSRFHEALANDIATEYNINISTLWRQCAGNVHSGSDALNGCAASRALLAPQAERLRSE